MGSVTGTRNHIESCNLENLIFFVIQETHLSFLCWTTSWVIVPKPSVVLFLSHIFAFAQHQMLSDGQNMKSLAPSWCLVGKKNKTKWHGHFTCACPSAKVFSLKKKSHPWAFCKSRLLFDGSQSTLEQHDLTLINAESYQGLKAASQAAHIPCVCTGHWL